MFTLKLIIRHIEQSDRDDLRMLLNKFWGSEKIVSNGKIFDSASLPGLIAFKENEILGFLTYNICTDQLEIVTLNSIVENSGVGTGLIDSLKHFSRSNNIKRIFCITTNDNLHALRFYQKKGFYISAIRKNEIEKSRMLKPEIPLLGISKIPIRDEIELELML